jgi:hypothetical protein
VGPSSQVFIERYVRVVFHNNLSGVLFFFCIFKLTTSLSTIDFQSLTAGPSLKFQEPRRPIAIHYSEEENWHCAKESLVLEYEEVKKKDNYSTSHPLYLQLLGLDLDKEE